MALEMGITIGALRSFKRLSYTPWQALAEFVDNSTQSYRDNHEVLARVLAAANEEFTVAINYESATNGPLVVVDNALGMSFRDLERAMIVGEPPENPWRSRYGFGLKTAASWFGDTWSVETQRLGEAQAYRLTVNVDDVATGNIDIPYEEISRPVGGHYTTVTIPRLRHPLHSRTRGKIREFLQSMYRNDLCDGSLDLRWLGERLTWDDSYQFADESGHQLRQDFEFELDGKLISGWAGVLAKGGRPLAGFSILHAGRVIRGTPDAWRPQAIYGQIQGSNDLVNQRLVGEIDLSAFEVSQTKDFVSWEGDQEQVVELALKRQLQGLIDAAKRLRKPASKLSVAVVKRAIDDIQRELLSEAVSNAVTAPNPAAFEVSMASATTLVSNARRQTPDFTARYNDLAVSGYLLMRASPEDEYLAVDSSVPGLLVIVINGRHPHLAGLRKLPELSEHFQHCTYQALAQWQAGIHAVPPSAAAIRAFQSLLLRASASRSNAEARESKTPGA